MTRAAVIFDLDGTLIDSAPDIHAMANRLLAEAGAAPVTEAQTREFVGHGADIFLRRLRAARDLPEADHAHLLARFLEIYEGAVSLSRVYPGVVDTLARLKMDGHVLGVCTNKPLVPAEKVLDHLGLSGWFETLVGGDSLSVRKPDPAPLRHARAALGRPEAIFVGDSEVDAETAQNADLPFFLFTEGYRKTPLDEIPHTGAFSHWDDLPDMIAGLQQFLA